MPAQVKVVSEPFHTAIADSYANALAPVFWYLIPAVSITLALAFLLPEIPLFDEAGMVACGEAVTEAAHAESADVPAADGTEACGLVLTATSKPSASGHQSRSPLA